MQTKQFLSLALLSTGALAAGPQVIHKRQIDLQSLASQAGDATSDLGSLGDSISSAAGALATGAGADASSILNAVSSALGSVDIDSLTSAAGSLESALGTALPTNLDAFTSQAGEALESLESEYASYTGWSSLKSEILTAGSSGVESLLSKHTEFPSNFRSNVAVALSAAATEVAGASGTGSGAAASESDAGNAAPTNGGFHAAAAGIAGVVVVALAL